MFGDSDTSDDCTYAVVEDPIGGGDVALFSDGSWSRWIPEAARRES